MSITNIQLQPDIEQSLHALAEQIQRSENWVINEALREYLANQGLEAERWQETLIALDAVKRGDVVDGAAVHEWLASWGKENELPPPGR